MESDHPFEQKKKELPKEIHKTKVLRKDTQRKLPPKPIQGSNMFGKPAEFHEKAIVISLKSVIQEQKEYIENQKLRF